MKKVLFAVLLLINTVLCAQPKEINVIHMSNNKYAQEEKKQIDYNVTQEEKDKAARITFFTMLIFIICL